MNKLKLPSGLTEAEEAKWWFDNAEELAAEFLASPRSRNPDRGATARRFGIAPVLQIDPNDAALAHEQAKRKGVTIEQHLGGLIHEALQAEELRKAG